MKPRGWFTHPVFFLQGVFSLLVLAWSVIQVPALRAEDPSSIPTIDQAVLDGSLWYVSDYVSFVGKDKQGHVAFALDTNRGRDGETWQAEHFVVFHDQHQGWITLQGNGPFDHPRPVGPWIPDSPSFTFQGSPQKGLTISSLLNDLRLRIHSLPVRLVRTQGHFQYWLGSATATLQWKGRELSGRAVYEFLFIPDFNRLSRSYWRLWKEFQALYLMVENVGDLYLHQQESDRFTPLIGSLDGFFVVQEETRRPQLLQVTPIRYEQARGLYRWPVEWSVRWMDPEGTGQARLAVTHFSTQKNWLLGGFAMAIVQGTVTYQGVTSAVYGLAELMR